MSLRVCARDANTREAARSFLEDNDFEDIDQNTDYNIDQMSCLRSELFNISKRLNQRGSGENNLSYHNSRQPSNNFKMFETTDNVAPTRPSTNGFYLGELEPIDHEKARLKLKILLQEQLKNAEGQHKLDIERRLAEIGNFNHIYSIFRSSTVQKKRPRNEKYSI